MCEKRAFFSKAEAKMMLQSTLGSPSTARKECRFYRCDSCGLFHLTSMTIEEYEAKKLGTMNEPTQYLFESN
jgi:hypothetical protein